jgi:hypothetical protein
VRLLHFELSCDLVCHLDQLLLLIIFKLIICTTLVVLVDQMLQLFPDEDLIHIMLV